jgi:eukaryotic-like serine/threonine-protein kinase
MKSNKQEAGGDMEVLLSSDSVLAVNPRMTFRWSNKSAEADNRTRQAGGTPDESVGLPTLRPEERTLLALADGRRSIESLAKLAGMTTPVAVRHLRALYDRGILVTIDKMGRAEPSLGDILAPAAVTEAVVNAPVEHDHSGGSVGRDVDSIAAAGSGSAASTGGSGPTGATTLPGAGPAAAGSAATDKSGSSGSRKPPSGPNVTLFWTPANSDSGPELDGKVFAPTTAAPASDPGAQAPRPRRNSIEPAVVVVGSGGDSGAARVDSPGMARGPSEDARPRPSGSGATVVIGSGPTAVGAGGGPPSRSASSFSSSSEDAEAVPTATDTPSPSVAIPFRVGSYEVATRIAQGAMGSIYVCRRVGAAGFQRLFTLKVIRQYSTQKDVAAKSFMREAQFGALLNHPNVQTLVDVDNYEGQPFLILDYIEGTSLLELMDDRRPNPAVVVAVMLDVLRALQHIHDVADENGNRLGMVHNDVSPHNILVGVDGVTRLTDFGSARFSKRGDPADTEPVAAGKPAYMAPEQLRGEAVDARTDLFAVGVVMWTALTGQKLFAADSYDETVVRVMRRKIPPPSEFGAPACLDAVVLRALSRSPEGRYSSADEMARDLQAVATAEHLVAPGRDVGQWVRREYGEALADRKRKIQEAFGVPSARADGSPSQPRRPHRTTPKTTDGLERLPAKTVLLEAGDIQAALGAATAARARLSARDASRTQWAIVIASAVIAAFALTAAIIYLISSLNAPPPRKAVPAGAQQAAGSSAAPSAPAPRAPAPDPAPAPAARAPGARAPEPARP